MMREVVGAIISAVMGVVLLWFILPMLTTTYDLTVSIIDTSSPLMQTLLTLGNGVYQLLPWISLLVIGFLILAYATRREPQDIFGS